MPLVWALSARQGAQFILVFQVLILKGLLPANCFSKAGQLVTLYCHGWGSIMKHHHERVGVEKMEPSIFKQILRAQTLRTQGA